jgi:hypothetical protein
MLTEETDLEIEDLDCDYEFKRLFLKSPDQSNCNGVGIWCCIEDTSFHCGEVEFETGDLLMQISFDSSFIWYRLILEDGRSIESYGEEQYKILEDRYNSLEENRELEGFYD